MMPLVRESRGVLLVSSAALAIPLVALHVTLRAYGASHGEEMRTNTSSFPQTTLMSTQGSILAFAQDGGRLAWLQGREKLACPGQVRIRNLRTSRNVAIGAGNRWGEVCLETQTAIPSLALGGPRAVWGGFDGASNSGYGGVATSALGDRPANLERLTWQHRFWGDYLTATSGDGPTLVYSTLVVTHNYPNDDACSASRSCSFTVVGGSVKRVVGRRAISIPRVPPAVLVSVSRGRVLLVPADRSRGRARPLRNGIPRPAANASVEIREAATGAVIARFAPIGRVVAVALSDRIAVVLVQRGATKRIERRDMRTGRLLGRTPVPTETAAELDTAGSTIVYRVGLELRSLDTTTGRAFVLAKAESTPIGLSIEGRRVAWAENLSETQARIQAVTLR